MVAQTCTVLLSLVHLTMAGRCPLLAEDPFKVRGIRKEQNEWTADIFLKRWEPGAVLTIQWPSERDLISANHADVREIRDKSAVIALWDAGPDDGAFRVMLHVRGTHTTTPKIFCPEPGNEAATYDYDDDKPFLSSEPTADAAHDYFTKAAQVATTAAARWAAGAGAPKIGAPLSLTSRSKDGVAVTAASHSNFAWAMPSQADVAATASTHGVVAAAPGGLVAASEAAALSLPCADDTTDLTLYQLSTDTSAGLGGKGDGGGQRLACDQVALRLPAARLCGKSDSLSLLWLPPGSSVWATLQENLPSAQQFALLDGLEASSTYHFRLRFTRGVEAVSETPLGLNRFQDDTIRLGPPTGPVLTDGAPLTALLVPTAAPLQPVATSSSSVMLPWVEGSPCRPGLRFAVRVLHPRVTADSRAVDDALSAAPLLPASEVSIEDGAFTLKRLRCAAGCRLAISPMQLHGFELPPRITTTVFTPLLANVPDNACRLELRFRRRGAVLRTEELQQTLADELCSGLGCHTEQVRLVEQRLGGEFVIIDMLTSSTASASVQYLCDAFAASTRLECYTFDSSSESAGGGAGAGVTPSCEARGLFERDFMSGFDPRGGVLQLHEDGRETQLAPWLTSPHSAGTAAIGASAWTPTALLLTLLAASASAAMLFALATLAWSYHRHRELRREALLMDARLLAGHVAAVLPAVSAVALRSPTIAHAAASAGAASRVVKAKLHEAMDATPLRVFASEWYQAVLPAEAEPLGAVEDDTEQGKHAPTRTSPMPQPLPASVHAAAANGMVDVDLASPRPMPTAPEDEATHHLQLGAGLTPALTSSGHDEQQGLGLQGAGRGLRSSAADDDSDGEQSTSQSESNAQRLFSRFWGAATSTLGMPFALRTPKPAADARTADDLDEVREGAVRQRISFETVEGEAVESELAVVANVDTYADVERRLQRLGARILPSTMVGDLVANGQRPLLISTQYYDAEQRAIVEADEASQVGEMLKASSWRVLVLG